VITAKCQTVGISKDRYHPDSCDIPSFHGHHRKYAPAFSTYRPSMDIIENMLLHFRHIVLPWTSSKICSCIFDIPSFHGHHRKYAPAFSTYRPSMDIVENMLLHFRHTVLPWTSSKICSCIFDIPSFHGHKKGSRSCLE